MVSCTFRVAAYANSGLRNFEDGELTVGDGFVDYGQQSIRGEILSLKSMYTSSREDNPEICIA